MATTARFVKAAENTRHYKSHRSVRLAMVAYAILLGGFNRFIVMPSLLDGLRGGGERDLPSLRRFTLVLRKPSEHETLHSDFFHKIGVKANA